MIRQPLPLTIPKLPDPVQDGAVVGLGHLTGGPVLTGEIRAGAGQNEIQAYGTELW